MRLVLCLKPNEPYMAFKYSRYVTQSIEIAMKLDSEAAFEQMVVA